MKNIMCLVLPTRNFIIFDAILLPFKFVVSVRSSLSSHNEGCIKSSIINREKRTVQSVDSRPLVMKQNHYFLTLDQSWLSKLTISSKPTSQVLSDDRPNRFGQVLAISSALYNDQQLSPYLNDALCKYWWPYVLTIHDLTSSLYKHVRKALSFHRPKKSYRSRCWAKNIKKYIRNPERNVQIRK